VLPARSAGECIPIELLVGEQLVRTRCKVGETKFTIGPGPKCASWHPMFLSLADLAAVQLQENSQVAFRTWNVDVPNN